jgi:hypothetical protein
MNYSFEFEVFDKYFENDINFADERFPVTENGI